MTTESFATSELITPRTPREAIEWGRAQIHHPTQDWTRWCLSFVRQAYGLPAVYHDAGTAWDKAVHKHRAGDPSAVPRGAPVFWELPGTADHVALSLGDGRCLTTDFVRKGHVDIAHISDITRGWNGSSSAGPRT